jgi:DNA-binding GntR family transcriptional regulator
MITLQEIRPLEERLTKRRHIYKSLQQQIHSHSAPPGSPLPATHELAKHFAVSHATMQAAIW